MKIINHTSFDIVDDENINDFIKYYGIVMVNEDKMLELKLNFDDLPYESQLALVRYEDEEYENTILNHYMDQLDKSSLLLLLKSVDHSLTYYAKYEFQNEIDTFSIKLYKENCQETINYWCAKISEEEQKSFAENLKNA